MRQRRRRQEGDLSLCSSQHYPLTKAAETKEKNNYVRVCMLKKYVYARVCVCLCVVFRVFNSLHLQEARLRRHSHAVKLLLLFTCILYHTDTHTQFIPGIPSIYIPGITGHPLCLSLHSSSDVSLEMWLGGLGEERHTHLPGHSISVLSITSSVPPGTH